MKDLGWSIKQDPTEFTNPKMGKTIKFDFNIQKAIEDGADVIIMMNPETEEISEVWMDGNLVPFTEG